MVLLIFGKYLNHIGGNMKLEQHQYSTGKHYWLATCSGPTKLIIIEADTRSEAFYQAVIAINEQGIEQVLAHESRH